MLVLLLVKEVLHLYWAMFSAPIVMISRTWVPEVRGHAVTTMYSSVLCPVRAPGPPWMFRNWVKLNRRRENRRPREKYDEKAAKQRDQGRKTSFSTVLSSLPPSRIYCSSLAWLRLLASQGREMAEWCCSWDPAMLFDSAAVGQVLFLNHTRRW